MLTINKQAPRLWLLGILSSLMANLHRIQKAFAQQKTLKPLLLQGAPVLSTEAVWEGEMRKVTKDALQDMIDLIIPLSLLGWINATPGTVGLAGSITSLMGIASLYPSRK